jgi:polar amino acid transport system permease protein
MIHKLGASDLLYILSATQWTLLLSAFAIFGGAAIAVLVVTLRLNTFRPLGWLTVAYVQFFQATPPLMQLFLVYYGASLFGVKLESWSAALIAFSLYSSAYLGDIWHGCITAVPKGQWEGARALSLTEPLAVLLVIVPQAFRISVPPTVGFLVQLIKTTSLASIIGFIELMRAGQYVNNSTLQPLVVYGFVACIYFMLCWPLSLWARALEKKLAKGQRGHGLATGRAVSTSAGRRPAIVEGNT